MNGIRGISFRETEKGLEVRVHKSKSSSSGKLKKRLPYNIKQLSRQISQAKTSDSARSLVSKMQAKLSWLYKKLKSGEYGEREVSAAIIHAASMERIAKRKVKHLEEEEAAENGAGAAGSAGEEEEIYGKDELKESMEENREISDEMMRKMMEEIEELEKELAEDAMAEMQDMLSCAPGDMRSSHSAKQNSGWMRRPADDEWRGQYILSEEEIDELKRKHRNSEEKQLTKADLRYLKALFDGLEQEKRQLASGGVSSAVGSDSSSFSCGIDCVPEVESMDMDVGDFVDVSV